MIATPHRDELLRLHAEWDERQEAALDAWRALCGANGQHTQALADMIEQTRQAMRAAIPERRP